MGNDPQFNYYCKLINIEPSYIQNKIKRYSEVKFTKNKNFIETHCCKDIESKSIKTIGLQNMLRREYNEKTY